MKTRTLIELMTLGSNLYLMSQDKELMEKLAKMASEGKQKLDDFMHTEGGVEDDEMSLFQKLTEKAKEVEKQLEQRLEEAAVKVYQKLHIAHINDIEALQSEINQLKEELAALKSRAN
jgi:polyhydroxyalkanoate synthesis regulator phasin